jgi:hypothetical protein
VVTFSLLKSGALIGALFFSGCHCASTGASRFDDRQVATPLLRLPPDYYRWWRRAEECAGIEKPMRVRFYAIAKQSFRLDSVSGVRFLGVYIADTNKVTGRITERIYLAAPWMFTEWLVTHEMLHAVLQRDSVVPGHPELYFAIRCRLMNWQHMGRLPTPPPIQAPVIPIPQQTIPHLPEVP